MHQPITELDKVTSLEAEFPAEALAKVDEIIEKNRMIPGSLITILHRVQGVLGHLPFLILKKIARELNMPESDVVGVVTFYSFFSIKPRGKYVIKACLGTACYVKGGSKIVTKLQSTLNVKSGDMTKDRLFTLEEVRCLGACGKAPAMMIGEFTHGLVDPKEVPAILDSYRQKK